jgi:hypothetical protein
MDTEAHAFPEGPQPEAAISGAALHNSTTPFRVRLSKNTRIADWGNAAAKEGLHATPSLRYTNAGS